MCGWVGYISSPDDDFDHAATIRAMADTIVHRGPDQDDYFVGDGVALGFRRLSMRPASIGPVKHLIRRVSLIELRQVIDEAIEAGMPTVRGPVTAWLARQ